MDEYSAPDLHQFGDDRGRGNLLGIEPYMTQRDYASRESFFDRLNAYLFTAQGERWLDRKTIVVFPEYVGSWLVLAGEGEKVFRSATLGSAEKALVLHHPFRFLSTFLASKEKGRAEAAFFRMKATQMAEIYHDVFSQLARDYSATIVAGSIVLPAPRISDWRLIPSEGTLQNVSVVYRGDGEPHPRLVRKAFPTAKELPFTVPASADDLPSFDTPAGRLGVLVCADSWYPQSYIPLKAQRIDLLAVPSYDVDGMQRWKRPWQGYDGWQPPSDVDANDIRKITEAQAWLKYSLAGRIRSSGASYGMNIFLRGRIWDQDLGGWPATVVRSGEVFVEEQTDKAAMLNMWL